MRDERKLQSLWPIHLRNGWSIGNHVGMYYWPRSMECALWTEANSRPHILVLVAPLPPSLESCEEEYKYTSLMSYIYLHTFSYVIMRDFDKALIQSASSVGVPRVSLCRPACILMMWSFVSKTEKIGFLFLIFFSPLSSSLASFLYLVCFAQVDEKMTLISRNLDVRWPPLCCAVLLLLSPVFTLVTCMCVFLSSAVYVRRWCRRPGCSESLLYAYVARGRNSRESRASGLRLFFFLRQCMCVFLS